MNEYKWFKDDFENDLKGPYSSEAHKDFTSSSEENSESGTGEEQNFSYEAQNESAQAYDYNTSGTHYEDYTAKSESDNFYNTTVKHKKAKKKVSVFALVAAVVLSIGVSAAASVYLTKAFPDIKDKIALVSDKNEADKTKGDTPGAKVVAQATADSDGNKALTTPEIVDKVGPAVVGIVTKSTSYYGYYGFGSSEQQGSGSGVIISRDGYIVTNNHVIENANEVNVILNTSETYKARVVGADAATDVAVVKIDASELPYAVMGKSSDLRVGDTAIAIGNPLGQEFAGTTTQGIISGLNRSVTIDNKQLNLIQTDAAINPGNSGGALVNAYGQLIGINTAKISSSSLEGLGFAIPIDEAKPIIEDLINNGYVKGRPVIGIAGRAVTKEDAEAYGLKIGVYVSSMTPNSPAYMAGVKIGDIITECDGVKVETVEEINKIKNKKQPGDEMTIKVYRQGEYKKITLILGEDMPSIE